MSDIYPICKCKIEIAFLLKYMHLFQNELQILVAFLKPDSINLFIFKFSCLYYKHYT